MERADGDASAIHLHAREPEFASRIFETAQRHKTQVQHIFYSAPRIEPWE
jgi:hypothetical protein